MALELYYTSSPRGLRPGTSGLCTVAMTRSMSAALASRLESLCGYRPPGEGVPIDQWPAALSHWTIDVGGVERHVLAAVRPVKPDHTMRSNTLAHFAVLHPSELDAAGAAWMLAQPETSAASWSGEPRLIDAERAMPRGGPVGARACSTWRTVAGDAGWAGVLANAAMLDPTKPATVIYPRGTRALDLVAEAMSLLPEAYRWRVTFTTYFTQPIAGVRCTWRFCLDGTSAATAARQAGGLVIDACAPAACTRTGEFVEAARAGREPVLVAPPGQPSGAAKPATRSSSPNEGPVEVAHGAEAHRESMRPMRARRPVGVDEPVPAASPGGRRALAVAVVVAVALLAVVAVLSVLMRTMSQQAAELEARAASLEQELDALRAAGDAAAALREERDGLAQQLGEVTRHRSELESAREAAASRMAELEARLKRLEPADAPVAPKSGAAREPMPPDSLQAAPTQHESAGTAGSAEPSATSIPADAALNQRRGIRRAAVGAAAAQPADESIAPPSPPTVTAMKDETVPISWPALGECGAGTVALSLSPALQSAGFVLKDGATLAFGGGRDSTDVARAEIGASGIAWTWITSGVQRIRSALEAGGIEGPDGWSAVLGQLRLHVMCADGIERVALMGQPRAKPWNIGARGGSRLEIAIPSAMSTAAAVEWGGSQVQLGDAESTAESPAGAVRARMMKAPNATARIVLEWGPLELENAEIECIGQLEAAIAQERALELLWRTVTQWSDSLRSPPQASLPAGEPFAAAQTGFEEWQAGRIAGLDKSSREAFSAQPASTRVGEYRNWLWESRLKPARDALTVRRSECAEISGRWRGALDGAVVLVRPEAGSPPVARIDPVVVRTLPELPFAPRGAGGGARQ